MKPIPRCLELTADRMLMKKNMKEILFCNQLLERNERNKRNVHAVVLLIEALEG